MLIPSSDKQEWTASSELVQSDLEEGIKLKTEKCNNRGRRRLTTAIGFLLLSFVSAGMSLWHVTELRAVQDSNQAYEPETGAELRIPQDISEEAIEKIDPAIAAAVAPLLNTLFDVQMSREERLKAATDLEGIARGLIADTTVKSELKSRLLRRSGILKAALEAAAVPSLSPGASSNSGELRISALDASNWLKTVANGELWETYLHLNELGAEPQSADILQQTLRNLTPHDGMDKEQKMFLTRPRLQSLRASVESAIALTKAVDGDEATVRAELSRQLDRIVAALLAYETTQLVSDAEKVRTGYRVLRSRFPAAADVLRPQIMNHYFNHNLHFTLSESLLSRLVSDYRTESGCIADCILGAWVTGSQVTNVNVAADVTASSSSAGFQILANGSIQSNTTAQKSPATVFSRGNHAFSIRKPVSFTGRQVSSSPGNIDVSVNNQTVGIRTKYDGIPIIGGIVRKMAWKKVAENAPQSRAITSSRISDQALPKFETEVSNQLSEQNSTLQKTLNALDSKGVGPDSISARSSNTHIAVSSRTMGVTRLGGSAQPPVLLSLSGLAIQLHESALNNTVDALGFNGRTIPEEQVIEELEAGLSDLLQRDIKLGKDDNQESKPEAAPAEGEEPEPPTSFVFSATDPIRAHFEDNQVVLVLRTGVIQEGREEIPEQVITIPVSISVNGGKLIVDPGSIRVTSAQETNRAKQITRANQIRRILGRKIIRRELDTTFDLQASGDRKLPLTVTLIELSDGWVTAELQ